VLGQVDEELQWGCRIRLPGEHPRATGPRSAKSSLDWMVAMRLPLPLVSVVTPSCNQGRYIEETIQSVQSQEYPNLEHIIVDCGSDDDTIRILREHEHAYAMRWVSEPDKGHSDAVNKGFRMAHGEIIGWLNSDDVYIDPSVVRTVVQVFREHPEADVVYGDALHIGDDGTILWVRCLPRFRYHRLQQWCFLEQPAVFLAKRVVDAYQLNEAMTGPIDYEYWLRIGRAYRFHHVPKVLAADRDQPNRISVVRAEEMRVWAEQLRRQHGRGRGVWNWLTRFVDVILSGIPRRAKGLYVVVSLRRKHDWSFPRKWRSICRTLFSQLTQHRRVRSLAGTEEGC